MGNRRLSNRAVFLSRSVKQQDVWPLAIDNSGTIICGCSRKQVLAGKLTRMMLRRPVLTWYQMHRL